VASVVAAVVFWFLAKGEQPTARLFTMPIVLTGVPEGLTTTERLPESARVLLSGANKDLLRLSLWGEPFARVDLSGAEPDRTIRVSLSEANISIPEDSEVAVAEIRHPRILDVTIDRVAERRLPVEAALAGDPAAGHYVLGEPLCVPDSVSVIGPERVVRALPSVRTAPLDLSGRSGRVEASRAVNVSAGLNLYAVPREVRVTVDIEASEQRTFTGVAVRVLRDPGPGTAVVSPAVVDVAVSGPAHLVNALASADVSVVIDARGLPRGNHELAPEVALPDDVRAASVRPQRLAVTLR
jgi:YbbR domain-containing protein